MTVRLPHAFVTGTAGTTSTKRLVAAGDGRWNAGLLLHNNRPQQIPGSPNISGHGYTPNLNYGMLWAYTDCLAKKGPILKSPADKFLVGADPVTGRNQQVDLAWEQLCLATGYELANCQRPELHIEDQSGRKLTPAI